MFSTDDVGMVGESLGMREAMASLRLVARSGCNPVLILGETGTGKELAARAVHLWRHGAQARLVAVNCAAMTASLLESELFGHVRGAFTGADRDKPGLFESARGGTILLDEISEMPVELQAKLLRVLQERAFRRVGSAVDEPCNATVIASSNRDLAAEVACGRFRQDLYYRLAVFPVTLPPLRSASRQGDVLALARHFLRTSPMNRDRSRELTESAARKLLEHPWPGNVRELKNVMERAVLLAGDDNVRAEHIVLLPHVRPEESARAAGWTGSAPATAYAPAACAGEREYAPASRHAGPACPPAPAAGTTSCPEAGGAYQSDRGADSSRQSFLLETAERMFILRALRETQGHRTRAAALLGITRATLLLKLKRYGLERGQNAGFDRMHGVGFDRAALLEDPAERLPA